MEITCKNQMIIPTKSTESNGANNHPMRQTADNLPFIIKTDTHNNNGGSIMKKCQNGTQIIYRENIQSPTSSMEFKSKRTLTKCLSANSALGRLMQEGEIPKTYYQTICWYEILRNFSLSDGPGRSQCMLNGRPRLQRRYVKPFITDAELRRADKITKLWRDSVHILKQNQCKELLDILLLMETVANDHALFASPNLQNLRKGLRDLTQYYASLTGV